MMYQCSKKLVKYKEYSCFDHSDFPAHSMFTFDVCWGSLGTSIFGNSSSAANITRSKLPSRLSFRFFWLWLKSSGWMTVIYFFLDICVFWVLFTSVRVTIELPAINVEKRLRWRLRAFLFVFLPLLKKVFVCLVGSYYWDNFRSNQSISF